MSKYLHAPISDVLSTVIDHRGRTPKKLGADWSESGIQVLSAMNIKAGKVDSSLSKNFIERDVFERWMPEKLKVGDILMTSEAPLGSVALLTIDREVCLGQRLFALRADKSKLDSEVLLLDATNTSSTASTCKEVYRYNCKRNPTV